MLPEKKNKCRIPRKGRLPVPPSPLAAAMDGAFPDRWSVWGLLASQLPPQCSPRGGEFRLRRPLSSLLLDGCSLWRAPRSSTADGGMVWLGCWHQFSRSGLHLIWCRCALAVVAASGCLVVVDFRHNWLRWMAPPYEWWSDRCFHCFCQQWHGDLFAVVGNLSKLLPVLCPSQPHLSWWLSC
jgi:hypothetical protein